MTSHLSDAEKEEIRQRTITVTNQQISEMLEELACRELQLLEDSRFGENKERRDEILWIVSVLTAAAERLF